MIKFFERCGRKLLVRLLAAFTVRRERAELTKPREAGVEGCGSIPKKILVIRLDERLGNLIMLTPLLHALRDLFPQAQIDLLAAQRGRALLENDPVIDRFIGFQKKSVLAPQRPATHAVKVASRALRRGN